MYPAGELAVLQQLLFFSQFLGICGSKQCVSANKSSHMCGLCSEIHKQIFLYVWNVFRNARYFLQMHVRLANQVECLKIFVTI